MLLIFCAHRIDFADISGEKEGGYNCSIKIYVSVIMIGRNNVQSTLGFRMFRNDDHTFNIVWRILYQAVLKQKIEITVEKMSQKSMKLLRNVRCVTFDKNLLWKAVDGWEIIRLPGH